jgi:hypothetical protein
VVEKKEKVEGGREGGRMGRRKEESGWVARLCVQRAAGLKTRERESESPCREGSEREPMQGRVREREMGWGQARRRGRGR